MAKIKPIKPVKYNYSGIKFTIHQRVSSNKLYIDFYFDGKRVRRSTQVVASKEGIVEVKRVLIPDIAAALVNNLEQPKVEDKDWILDDFAQEYFILQKSKVRKYTLERIQAHYSNHIFPYFGHRLVDTLKPIELEKWQNELLQKYKQQTVQKFRSILFSILAKAVDNDIILKNPLEKVTAPKLLLNYSSEDKVVPFTEEQLESIISSAKGYMKNFITFMYSTGMRPGEIIALRWSDINFERKIINISKTRQRNQENKPKTQSSIRCVDLLPLAEKALKKQYKLTKELEYIFVNSSNEPFYSHDVISVNFNRILDKLDIKVQVLYNLRHTFASQLISKGADIVWVSKMLGHKDISITLKIYTKFIEESDEKRFKKIEKMDTLMDTLLI